MASEVVNQSIAEIAAKGSVPAVLTGQLIFGYSLNEWAAIAGILYTVIQTAFLIQGKIASIRKAKAERNGDS